MQLLEELKKHGNPIIEPGLATFVWQGSSAPMLVSDLYDWETNPQLLSQVGSDLWALPVPLADDAYLEYGFYDPHTQTRCLDKFNRRRVNNGVGGRNNFFYMPAAGPTPFARSLSRGLRGRLTTHRLDSWPLTTNKSRRIVLYHPPVNRPVPLLVVYDGLEYLHLGRLAQIVDNLIAEKRINPIGLAFCQNAGLASMVEYGCSERTLTFVTQKVLPLAAGEMELIDHKQKHGAHGIMGSSMSGLMAVYSAMKFPEIFGKVICQAGAFELDERESTVMQMVRYFPSPDIKLWLGCGVLDFLLDANRRMSALLAQKGFDVIYKENGGAHNYTTWRDNCARGLEVLF